MEVNGFIYTIIDGTNDFEYIGQTTKTVEERFKQHTQADSYIGHVIRARGEDLFVVAVLKVCHSKDELDFWERHFIKSRNTKHPNGYNLTDGGEGTLGHKHSPETLKKLSASHKGRKCTPEHCAHIAESKRGEKNPFFGKNHTPETCEKMSESRKGQKRSLETRKRISEANKGKVFTPEHCEHISEAKKGQIPSDETRDRMSEARRGEKNHNYGKPRDPKTCSKIGAAQRGYSPYKNLLAELDARDMSYSALAKLLGVHPTTVTEKMRDKKPFTERDKIKLVEIFKKPIKELLARDESGRDEDVSKPKRKSPYKNLLAEIDARDMSYADLAKLMGLDKNSLARKIRGVRSFTESDKKKLAEIFFDKSIEYLLARDD